MPKYDANEALEVLGAFAEQKDPSSSYRAKDEAAKELLQQLAALDAKMIDLAAGEDPRFRHTTVSVGFSFAGARVTYAPTQGFIAFSGNDIKVPVPLRFNRARGIFEGEAVDTSRVPVPGELKDRRRDALAVLAEAIVEVLKKQG